MGSMFLPRGAGKLPTVTLTSAAILDSQCYFPASGQQKYSSGNHTILSSASGACCCIGCKVPLALWCQNAWAKSRSGCMDPLGRWAQNPTRCCDVLQAEGKEVPSVCQSTVCCMWLLPSWQHPGTSTHCLQVPSMASWCHCFHLKAEHIWNIEY